MRNFVNSVFCFLFGLQCLTFACINPEKGTMFADYALRSDVVLRAEVVRLNPVNNGAKGRYDATFRIIGLFSAKSQQFAIGDTIRLGQFGRKPLCSPIRPRSRQILFLTKSRDDNSKFTLRYNPVPLSGRNVIFFEQVLKNKRYGRKILKSGCRVLQKPLNGKYQCTPNLERCRIKCHEGFELIEGSKYKSCDVISGRWKPEITNECVLIKKAAISPLRNLLLNWSPKKRKVLPKTENNEEVEELEEVNEEIIPQVIIRTKPKSWSISSFKRTFASEEEIEEEEEQEEEEEEEGQNVIIKPRSKWNLKPKVDINPNVPNKEDEETEEKEEQEEEEDKEKGNNILKPFINFSFSKPKLNVKPTSNSNKEINQDNTEKNDTDTKPNVIKIESTLNVGNITVKKSDPNDIKIDSDQVSLRSFEFSSNQTQSKPGEESVTTAKTVSKNTNTDNVPSSSPTTNKIIIKPLTFTVSGTTTTKPLTTTTTSSFKNETVPDDSWTEFNGLLYQPVTIPNLEGVFGCPTSTGTVTIFSSWRDGFSGNFYIPAFDQYIVDWVVQISFDIEVEELEMFTVDLLTFSHNKFDYCFKPKIYNRMIYLGQDLTLSFVGKVKEKYGNYPEIKGQATLYGLCSKYDLKDRNIGTLMPSENEDVNKENKWVESSQIPVATDDYEDDS